MNIQDTALSAKEFVDLIRPRFLAHADKLESYYEDRFQLIVNDALLDAERKSFREYPYPTSGKCDVVVTASDDWSLVTHWIEIKPLWQDCGWWSPSSFFRGDFEHDIRKLSQLPGGAKWFLFIALSECELFEELVQNPRRGSSMSVPQMVSAFSRWAKAVPLKVDPFPAADHFCHMFLWEVANYHEQAIRIENGTYYISDQDSGNA